MGMMSKPLQSWNYSYQLWTPSAQKVRQLRGLWRLVVGGFGTWWAKRDGRWIGNLFHIVRSGQNERPVDRNCDSLPVPWLARGSCFGKVWWSNVSFADVLCSVLWRDFNPCETLSFLDTRLSEHWDVCVYVCVCGVLILPLPLCPLAYLCHHATILPSVLVENQVLNALRLGLQLIPCSQASFSLWGQFMPKCTQLKWQVHWRWAVPVQFASWNSGMCQNDYKHTFFKK